VRACTRGACKHRRMHACIQCSGIDGVGHHYLTITLAGDKTRKYSHIHMIKITLLTIPIIPAADGFSLSPSPRCCVCDMHPGNPIALALACLSTRTPRFRAGLPFRSVLILITRYRAQCHTACVSVSVKYLSPSYSYSYFTTQ